MYTKLNLTRIDYDDLNARQKENYNFQKLSAVLADYGFVTLRLSDDWQGADFIAQHIDGNTFIKVQLKGRLTFAEKYCGRELYVAFQDNGEWYLFPHDEVLQLFLSATTIENTESWQIYRGYSFTGLSRIAKQILQPYKIVEHK